MGILKAIKEVDEGAVLSKPVINRMGQLLLPTGAELTTRSLQMLKTWGVTAVEIDAGLDQNDNPNQLDDEIVQMAEDRLSSKILWKPTNDYEKALFQAALNAEVSTILNNTRTNNR